MTVRETRAEFPNECSSQNVLTLMIIIIIIVIVHLLRANITPLVVYVHNYRAAVQVPFLKRWAFKFDLKVWREDQILISYGKKFYHFGAENKTDR